MFIGFLIESVLSDFFLNSILGVEANLGTNIHNTICNFKSKKCQKLDQTLFMYKTLRDALVGLQAVFLAVLFPDYLLEAVL